MNFLNKFKKLWGKKEKKANTKCTQCKGKLVCRDIINEGESRMIFTCPVLNTTFLPSKKILRRELTPEPVQNYIDNLCTAGIKELSLFRDTGSVSFVKEKVIQEYNEKYETQITKTMLINLDLAIIFSRSLLSDIIEANYQTDWIQKTGESIESFLIACGKMLEDFAFVSIAPFSAMDQEEYQKEFHRYLMSKNTWRERRSDNDLRTHIQAVVDSNIPSTFIFQNDLDQMHLNRFEDIITRITCVVNCLEFEYRTVFMELVQEETMKQMHQFLGVINKIGGHIDGEEWKYL